MPALKAVSQSLMHANLSITDGVYGILSGMDVKSEITELGKQIESKNLSDMVEISAKLERILLMLGNG